MNLLQSNSEFHHQHEALTLLSKVLREFLYFQKVVCIHCGPGGGQRPEHVRLQRQACN